MARSYAYPCYTESREKRISRVQSMRLRLAGLLTVFSLIELAVLCMGYYTEVPYWLMVANIVCIFFNFPLIMWLMSVWNEQRKREDAIRKNQERRRKEGV